MPEQAQASIIKGPHQSSIPKEDRPYFQDIQSDQGTQYPDHAETSGFDETQNHLYAALNDETCLRMTPFTDYTQAAFVFYETTGF